MKNNEDYEMEAQKDLIYLLEEQKLLEEELMKEMYAEQRKEAKITVIDASKIPKRDENRSEVLPF